MEAKPRLHPLLATAAISVTLFALVGVAAVTGLLPRSNATRPAEPPVPTSTAVEQFSAVTPPLPVADAPAVAHPTEHKPAARKAVRHVAAPKPAPILAADAGAASLPLPPPPVAAMPAAPAPVAAPAAVAAAPAPACADCGTVENFRQVEVKGDGSALGAVAGGAAGALVGHQFGRGSGKDLLTIAGAIGGAFAGHEVERNVRKKTRYEISVRMQDGSLRTVAQDTAPVWRIGERVRVVDNHLVANS